MSFTDDDVQDERAFYHLDENGRLLPPGVPGELCVAGVGLARGYLNNPELTAEKFVPHPFKKGERIYRTGDLARWLPDGIIEFFGRMDGQLKIRGHRIEVGEIERALLAHPAVHSNVVEGKPINDVLELAAYLVAKPGKELPDVAALRAFLLKSLPEYMIPAYFMELESLPLSANGKVDRKQLPELDAEKLSSGTKYLAPRNAVEGQLASIWEEVLDSARVGVYDNFFHLGGHSLRAMRLGAWIQKRFGVHFPLQLAYQYPTLAGQAAQLSTLKSYRGGYLHRQGLRFNLGAATTVFTFPPFFGLGVWYQQLAAELPDVSFYCFDFLLDENRLELYYQQIKKEQEEGPYTLFGYSAGGILAIEMAAFMENKGEQIAAVILGDSRIVAEDSKISPESYLNDLELTLADRTGELAKGLLDMLQQEAIREQSRERLVEYQEFLHGLRAYSIQADIHLLQAELEPEEKVNPNVWKTYTRGAFRIYPASGTHDYLFEPPYLTANTNLLITILEQSRLVKDNVLGTQRMG